MGLWEIFGKGFQNKNLIPKIPTIPKITLEPGQKTNSRDFRDFRYKDIILKNASREQEREEGQGAESRKEPAKGELFSMPEESPSAVPGEAMPKLWRAETGEASEAGARARALFGEEPPTDNSGFPCFPAFCTGYGKGCCDCRFLHHGYGAFCKVFGEAWPDFYKKHLAAMEANF